MVFRNHATTNSGPTLQIRTRIGWRSRNSYDWLLAISGKKKAQLLLGVWANADLSLLVISVFDSDVDLFFVGVSKGKSHLLYRKFIKDFSR